MKIIIIVITFIWVGMVLGISFLEAPLKFRAPNITLELGLGIGKLVFGALNKVEITFAVVLILSFVIGKSPINQHYLYAVPLVILLLQTFWLMPVLDARIEQIVVGQEVPKTYHHLAFIVLEVIKLIGLLFAGIRFIKVTSL